MITRLFCIAAAGLGFTSCLNKDANTCSATQVEPAITATGPRTVAVNQAATFTLAYMPLTTCGAFESFLEQATGTANSYNVGVRVKYSQCTCPASATITQTTYTFKPTRTGTYYLNFIANTTTGFITDTLVVQ
ncbi:MAG: hypothetical protein EOO62_35335 [Hymenobacter sp.]|nr:MAG: hypothetical protein EOO62_35335 [Hymenobacter sp.]